MKISELVLALEALRAEHGDLLLCDTYRLQVKVKVGTVKRREYNGSVVMLCGIRIEDSDETE